MSTTLYSARLKLDRARHHLEAFHRTEDGFLESEPYHVMRELQFDSTQHVYRVQVRKQPPEQLPLIVGDVLQNLRSALDHMVFALSDTPLLTDNQRKSISFPVIPDETLFHKKNTEDVKSVLGLGLMSPLVRAAVKGLQPTDDRDYLALLHHLNNVDKHRVIHAVGAISAESTHFRPYGVDMVGMTIRSSPFEHGTEIARFTFSEPQPDVDVKFNPIFEIGLADSPEAANCNPRFVLRRCMDRVNDALAVFEAI